MSTAPQSTSERPVISELHQLRDHWLLLLILGIMLILIGTFAIISPFIATLATVTFFGTLLFIGAVIQLVNALTCRNWRGFFVHLMSSLIFGVVGLIMMNHPPEAAAGLTLMIAAGFILGGIVRIVVSAIERFQGWPWVLLNGFITLFLGLYIWRHFPQSAFWLIGIFVGVELIFNGWAWIDLALTIRFCIPKQT
jgi:uncharacterized membrane protein HdeD (DUF308 family)